MSAPINVRDLAVGAAIMLLDGSEAEVIENPGDGIWLFARYLSAPHDPTRVGREDMVFAQDVVAVGRAGGAG
jgi:hypothetical protein